MVEVLDDRFVLRRQYVQRRVVAFGDNWLVDSVVGRRMIEMHCLSLCVRERVCV